jgi:hypothetical protein
MTWVKEVAMPITFASDFDYSSMRHVSVRSKRKRELALPPLPTKDDVSMWETREIRVGRKLSWRPNYDDGVEARRDTEKAVLDQAARMRVQKNPTTTIDKLSSLSVRSSRQTSSVQRIVADIVRAAPSELNWSGHLYSLPASRLLAFAKQAALAVDSVSAWNLLIRLSEPTFPSPFRIGTSSMWKDPCRPSMHKMQTLGMHLRKDTNALTSAWMQAAENGTLVGRRTRCELTGKSLVIKTNYFGRKTWSLAPAFHGMSAEAAQQVASAAAIKAGLVRGVVRGVTPPLVEHLRNNTADWFGLVLATRHPVFYAVASQLVKLGMAPAKFSDDIEFNRAEWERLSSIAMGKDYVYNNRF